MGKKEQEQGNEGIVTSVGALGVDHDASNDRSYWNNPELYVSGDRLRDDWNDFLREGVKQGNRRMMMRTYVSNSLAYWLQTSPRLPIEALLPANGHWIVYVGLNQHSQLAQAQNQTVPAQVALTLPTDYDLRFYTNQYDVQDLFGLWQQFGWTLEGVQAFVEAGTTPIVIIQHADRVIGTMIAEALPFGDHVLIELTEMAVADDYKGQRLAPILIRELGNRMYDEYGKDGVIYGEYNMTTNAHRSAARAGNHVANGNSEWQSNVTGKLLDHVAIELKDADGALLDGNVRLNRWETRFLHNFLVMYRPDTA